MKQTKENFLALFAFSLSLFLHYQPFFIVIKVIMHWNDSWANNKLIRQLTTDVALRNTAETNSTQFVNAQVENNKARNSSLETS